MGDRRTSQVQFKFRAGSLDEGTKCRNHQIVAFAVPTRKKTADSQNDGFLSTGVAANGRHRRVYHPDRLSRQLKRAQRRGKRFGIFGVCYDAAIIIEPSLDVIGDFFQGMGNELAYIELVFARAAIGVTRGCRASPETGQVPQEFLLRRELARPVDAKFTTRLSRRR
jgi:hypothetical protein